MQDRGKRTWLRSQKWGEDVREERKRKGKLG